MTIHQERIALVVPFGAKAAKRSFRIDLSPDIAQWLHAQLGEALGLPREQPRPKRQPRLRRGRWVERRARPW
jgi:hypothetical protein